MTRTRLFALLLACHGGACGPAADPAAEPTSFRATEPEPWGSGAGQGSWSYRALPEPPGADYAVEVDLRVDAPADLEDPVHQVSRFANYNNQEDLGGYEAALVLRRGEAGQYRLMVSTRWREALLWSSRGGVLQVRAFDFAPGMRYRLRGAVQGARVTLQVDDQPLLDYVDRTVPLTAGAPALARKEGTTMFGAAQVRGLPPSSGTAPAAPHRFSLRSWKGMRWGFDGDEPIFALGLPPNVSSVFLPTRLDCLAFEVKLVPGYHAQLYVPWYMQNWAGEIFSADELKELKVVEEGPRLKLALRCAPPAGRTDLTSRTEVTISFSEADGAYRYDHLTELTVPEGTTLGMDYPIDVTDPALLNGVSPGGPYGLQWPTTHTHSVYTQEEGGLYKLPHNHAGMYPGYVSDAWWAARLNYLKADGGFWAMVGDAVSNPVFRLQGQPSTGVMRAGPCGWAYDLHLEWETESTTLGPGTYGVRWQLGSVRGSQGDAWLQRAAFGTPGDLDATYLLYTGGIGHVERFDKVVLQASPFGEQPWGPGALQDRSVGHGDRTSLRLVGPAQAQSATGDGHFTESFEPGQDYEVSVWVKTQDVTGQGPGLRLAGQAYYPGIHGTTDWQRVSFTARPAGDLSMVPFSLHLDGAGTAWFDDFQIRPVGAASP